MSIEPTPLLDVEYPVKRTGLKRDRIYELCRLNLFPHIRFGRRIRFDPNQIEEWIRNGGQPLESHSAEAA